MRIVLRLCLGCFKKLFSAFSRRLNILPFTIQSKKFLKWVIRKKKVKNKPSRVWMQIVFSTKLKKQTPPKSFLNYHSASCSFKSASIVSNLYLFIDFNYFPGTTLLCFTAGVSIQTEVSNLLHLISLNNISFPCQTCEKRSLRRG